MGNRSRSITFPGASGAPLAARLDLPTGVAPHALALFAHCFTCSKDTRAAAFISEALADAGIATLRFDFTGLGGSGGDFANTSFSSNVGDLVAAADWLRRNFTAPAILVGHSFGGAAVLAAAPRIPEAAAVATINAPADPAHVARLFAGQRGEIEAAGEAQVELAGRTFRIRRDFLEDIQGQKLSAIIGALGRALIVFHAPRDTMVGIDNASAIFTAAKHPKSFVSLDDADHCSRAAATRCMSGPCSRPGRRAICHLRHRPRAKPTRRAISCRCARPGSASSSRKSRSVRTG